MMSALHTRLFGLLAVLWGSVLIYFYESGRIQKYLAPDFHHFVLIGGLGIIVLGLYSLINPQVKTACCDHHHHDHEHDDEHEHGHHHERDCNDHEHDCSDHAHDEGHGPLTTGLLTLLPLGLALAFTQDGYSALGSSRLPSEAPPAKSAPFTREDLEKNVPRNERGQFQLSLVHAYFAGGDRELHEALNELPVEIEGRLAQPERFFGDGYPRSLFRTFMSCCAADATKASLALSFEGEATALPDNAWVKAQGTLRFAGPDGQTFTVLEVTGIEETEEPYIEFIQRNR